MRVGKEMMPGGYNGNRRADFRYWTFKVEAYLVDQTYDSAIEIMNWAADQHTTITEAEYGTVAAERS